MRAEIHGRTLSYTDEGGGDGPALVFLHFFGGSSRAWRGVIDPLAGERRCIAVDVPGFGGSDPPLPGCTVESQAETIETLLDQLGVGDRVAIGHSMGGKLALMMAARRPEQVRELVLIATSPPGPEPGDEQTRRHLRECHGDRAEMTKLVDRITHRPLEEALRRRTVEDHLIASREAWIWWLADGVQEDCLARVEGLPTPTLLISGSDDPVFKPEVHLMLASRLPTSRHEVVPGAGHLIPLEAPDTVCALMRGR